MATVRRDVERIKRWGRNYDGRQDVLLARMAAVVGAQRALTAGEVGARAALRQSLVELAASAELVADGLPPPR